MKNTMAGWTRVGLCAAFSVLATGNAWALNDCFSVEVGGASERLVSLTFPKPQIAGDEKKPVRIEVRAKRDVGQDIVTPFECQRKEKEILCTQPDGAGDFYLTGAGNSMMFEVDYLNFALGASSGLPPRKDEDPIDEDYAILREDSGNDDTHPDRLKLKMESVSCPESKAGK